MIQSYSHPGGNITGVFNVNAARAFDFTHCQLVQSTHGAELLDWEEQQA